MSILYIEQELCHELHELCLFTNKLDVTPENAGG